MAITSSEIRRLVHDLRALSFITNSYKEQSMLKRVSL